MTFCAPVVLRSTNYMFNEANLQLRNIWLIDCSEEIQILWKVYISNNWNAVKQAYIKITIRKKELRYILFFVSSNNSDTNERRNINYRQFICHSYFEFKQFMFKKYDLNDSDHFNLFYAKKIRGSDICHQFAPFAFSK